MAKGLRIPVGVDSRGGTAWVEGEDNDFKTIMTALADCENENAFQQGIGLGADMIFDLEDQAIRAQIMSRLESIFAAFEAERRYKLVEESVEWSTIPDAGELVLTFRYFNMETDEEQEFTRRFVGNE